jgi:hypothetical protein
VRRVDAGASLVSAKDDEDFQTLVEVMRWLSLPP